MGAAWHGRVNLVAEIETQVRGLVVASDACLWYAGAVCLCFDTDPCLFGACQARCEFWLM